MEDYHLQTLVHLPQLRDHFVRHCRVLTSDSDNNCIHILDQDGHFLRFINNTDIDYPWGLWVDKKDKLFVGEFCSGKVKKITFIM